MPPTTQTTVRCQHCAEEFSTQRPKQAKWCPKCGSARRLLALADYPKKCLGCDAAFFKHDRKQTLCTTCSPSPAGVTNAEAPCGICHAPERLVPGLSLCYPCAGQVGKRHSGIVKALVRVLRDGAARKAEAPAPVAP